MPDVAGGLREDLASAIAEIETPETVETEKPETGEGERSTGERAVTAMATRSRRLTAVPFHELKNDVHIGHGVLRWGPYIML